MQKTILKRKTTLFILGIFLIGFLAMLPIQSQASNASTVSVQAAGTACSFSGDSPDQASDDAWITLYFDTCTANAEFIIVPSSASLTNHTFATGTSETTKQIQIKLATSGTISFTVYGYTVSSGVAAGSALDVWLVEVTPKSDQNADQISNLFPFFITLAIAGILIGVVFKKKYM